jgi:hypothetical protein
VPLDRAAPWGGSQLRPLNAPTAIRVQVDANGQPQAVWRRGWSEPRTVARVQDRWRIDDEWWREHAISRVYHALILDDGALLTVYHDLVQDAWFDQRP